MSENTHKDSGQNKNTPEESIERFLRAKEYDAFWSRQAKFWFLVIALFALSIWLFSSILLPFVLGAVIAYLLNPLVDYAQNKGISRIITTSVLLGGFIVVLIGLLSIVLPLISVEIFNLLTRLPDFINQLWVMSEPYRSLLEKRIGENEIQQLKNSLQSSSSQLLSLGQNFLAGLANSGQAMISFFSFMILMPIVAFFMMIEWPKITSWVDSHLPRDHAQDARGILSGIDKKLSGFIRGQMIVAFSLGVIYAIAMKLAGLNFGFLIGLGAGLLSIIPLVGSTVGLLVGSLVAWFQSYELSYVAIIAAIFLVGQAIEGNILTPKLIGDRVGLHPLWILFSIMAGGSLFGLLGIFIAVPVAAIISVLLGFGLDKYKDSRYYKATNKASETPDSPT